MLEALSLVVTLPIFFSLFISGDQVGEGGEERRAREEDRMGQKCAGTLQLIYLIDVSMSVASKTNSL